MAQLAGFKESGMRKIADRMGYTGPMTGFQAYLQENPDKQQMMNSYVNKAMLMASGGYVRKFQEGGFAIPEGFNPDSYLQENPDVQAAIEAGQFTSAADHFQKFGGGEERTGATGFTPPPQFDATSYLEANPDVGQAIERGEFQDARDHFQKFGGGEDREGVTGPTTTQTPTGTQPPTDTTTQPPAPPPGSVVGSTYLANRPDVAQAIAGGDTFGIDPATLQGLSEEEKNQRLAQAHFNAFGNQENINPVTGLSNAPSNFDGVSDQVIIDYLDQYPDLRAAFGPNNDPATLAKARAHYADFGRREIAEGGRPRLVQFDLTPAQLEAFRYSNDAYENLTPTELRRTYIQIGGAEGATNFDRNAQILNNAELAIYRDNNPDLANMSDFELRQHFIQFGRQEMLQGTRPKIDALVPPVSPYAGQQTIGGISTVRLETPTLVGDTKLQAQKIAQPGGAVPTGTTLPTTTGLGEVSGDLTASVAKAGDPSDATATTKPTTIGTATVDKAQRGVENVTTGTTGQDVTFTPDAVTGRVLATPKAAQQVGSAVTGIDAPKTEEVDKAVAATRPDMTPQETVLNNAIAENAAKFVEEIAAATATPTETATVKGQLKTLLAEFEKVDEIGNPINPPWAAGAMRAATAAMVRRGLGSSSIAGQAIVQAAMEAALPIAQADAQIQAQFEGQNLSNRQQMAAFYAQQRATAIGQEFTQEFQARVTNAARVADIADRNFTAEQQVVLENSRAVNTLRLQDLSNKQALTLAEASSLAQLDVANLNNRQQAAVQAAQAFLQKDLTEASNDQQVEIFNAQNRIQAILSDSAAENAARQFNATSQNQTDQFFANLATQTSQFNKSQENAIEQFNAGQENVINRFNEELANQRDQFNAQNRLVIDQSNAQWRRSIATADTQAINRANELNAAALLDISNTAYNDLWQYYADTMEFAYQSAESERDRQIRLAIAELQAKVTTDVEAAKRDQQSAIGFGKLIGTFLTAEKDSVIGSLLPI